MEPANPGVGVRAFVAIELPTAVREGLAAEVQPLAQQQLPVRVVQPASLHLTLAFIGDIPETQTTRLTAAVERGCGGVAAFDLRAEGRMRKRYAKRAGRAVLSVATLLSLVPFAARGAPGASAAPTSAPADGFADPAIQAAWQRADGPVAAGSSGRSWTWGPGPFY